jgi:hypothetical protein
LILYNIMGIKFDVIQLYGRSLMWYNIMGIRFDMIHHKVVSCQTLFP